MNQLKWTRTWEFNFVESACGRIDLIVVVTFRGSMDVRAYVSASVRFCPDRILLMLKGTTNEFGVHVYHDWTVCRVQDTGPLFKEQGYTKESNAK